MCLRSLNLRCMWRGPENKSGYTAIMLASLTAVESPGDMKVVQQLMKLGDVNASVGQVMGGISQLAQCTLYKNDLFEMDRWFAYDLACSAMFQKMDVFLF